MTRLQLLQCLHRAQMNMLRIEQMLDINELTEQEGNCMISQKEGAIIKGFADATDGVAARIKRVVDAGGMSPEAEAALNAEIATLTGLGKDPEDPIPTPAP